MKIDGKITISRYRHIDKMTIQTISLLIILLTIAGCHPKEQQDVSSINNPEYLTDSLTPKRDIVLLQKPLDDSKMSLRRVMKPLKKGEQPYSIRIGREILVAELDGKVIYEFEDIDSYSSLFIDSSTLRVIEFNNHEFYLQVSLFPHESLGHTWIYQFDSNFQLLDNFRSDKIEIRDSIVVVNNFLLSEEWGTTDHDMILSYLYKSTVFPIENFMTTDFYLLKDGKIVKVRTESPDSEFLRKVNSELDNLKKDTSHYFSEHLIKELQDKIITLVEEK